MKKRFLPVLLLLPLLGGCASPAAAYVAADRSTYDLICASSEKHPKGRLAEWLADAVAAGKMKQEEADLFLMKQASWKDRLDTAEAK